MTARISLIPGKARGHRPRLQGVGLEDTRSNIRFKVGNGILPADRATWVSPMFHQGLGSDPNLKDAAGQSKTRGVGPLEGQW